jgi:hypothetical protein
MNTALNYLWLTLLRSKVRRFCRGLRRPATLIGFAALASLFGVLLHFRTEPFFAELVRPESLVGGMMIMLGGSVFQGFLHRGLVFEPPDLEFIFTRPFTPRQIVMYRLLPNYLFAVLEGVAFLELLGIHLRHPVIAAAEFIVFQILCFHLSAAASIIAGTLSTQAHHRVRWMLLGVYFMATAVYFRAAWDVRILPEAVASSAAQLLFYPAVTLTDVASSPGFVDWTMRLTRGQTAISRELWPLAGYLGGLAAGALLSLGLLLKLAANFFEPSLASTLGIAEKRARVQQGRRAVASGRATTGSARLPKLALFRGAGAILWKNLIVARRSRRELAMALVFTVIYTAFLAMIQRFFHESVNAAGESGSSDITEFDLLCATLLGFLAFLLQRTLRFDFRADGHHLMDYRTLPFSPLTLAWVEIVVPTAFCLGFQGIGIAVLAYNIRFQWYTIALILLTYPAVALALNGVWNLHYLISATKNAGGKAQPPSAVGTLMVVALSFLIFWPAGWTAFAIGHHYQGNEKTAIAMAIAGWLAIQYAIDVLLVFILARLVQRFEVANQA